jgi:hypothetical protein
METAAPTLGGTHVPAAWPLSPRFQPGDFGAAFQTLARSIGTGGTSLTGTATTSVYVGIPASRIFAVVGASIQGYLGFTGASAITAQLVRINNQSTPTNVTLTAAASIKTDVFTGTDNNVDFPITATDQNRVLSPGDTLLWKIVCTGDVTAGVLTMATEISVIQ